MNTSVAKQEASLFPSRAPTSSALVEVESQRAIAETQAAMIIAKKFPRDQAAAVNRILNACTRPALAESAQYQYARGGSDITGPSIRMAETLAREWGNMQYGIRELTQANGESEVEAFCWDIETNTRQVKIFKVPHVRYTRAKGNVRLEDPRDIYETIANQGARRLRACILGVIPGDVVDAAMEQCDATLKTKIEITPELIKGMLEKFAAVGVTREMIEKRIQRSADAITPAGVVQLRRIFNSMHDGMGSVSDYFDVADAEPSGTAKTGVAGLKAAVAEKTSAKPTDDKEAKPVGATLKATYADVTDLLNKAKSRDQLDIAADLIRFVESEQQRTELTTIYHDHCKKYEKQA